MAKLIILTVIEGSFTEGFPVILRIGEEGNAPQIELHGKLPPAPQILEQYRQWQVIFHRGKVRGLQAVPGQVTNVSDQSFGVLKQTINQWLNSDVFRPIRERLLGELTSQEEVRFLVQTANQDLWRLPWQAWDFFEQFPKAELAISADRFTGVVPTQSPKNQVNILAILGDDAGINCTQDKAALNELPNAQVRFIVKPNRLEINDHLWEQAWDILFFAGHSNSQNDIGRIFINDTDSLTIAELKHALRKAIEGGLKLAIFNSCDGLGLAKELADLHIPQLIFMREPVPDIVAQAFLKYFLTAFSQGKSLYLAVKEARQRLQGLEDQFPFASWLPVLLQNPAETPPTWDSLTQVNPLKSASREQTLLALLMTLKQEKTPLSQALKDELYEVGELLEMDADDWEFIQEKLEEISSYFAQIFQKRLLQLLSVNEDVLSQLFPTQKEIQDFSSEGEIEKRGLFDEDLEMSELIFMSSKILKEDDPAKVSQQLSWLERVEQSLPEG